MYTTEQADRLKQYRQILEQYNRGQITYKEFVEASYPVWQDINKLFDLDQKSI